MNRSFKSIKKSYPRLKSLSKLDDSYSELNSNTHKRHHLQRQRNQFSQESLVNQSLKSITITSESEDVHDKFLGRGVPSRVRNQPKQMYDIDVSPKELRYKHSKSPNLTTASQKDIKLHRIRELHDKKAKERDEYIRKLKGKLNISLNYHEKYDKFQIQNVIKEHEKHKFDILSEGVLRRDERGKRIYAKKDVKENSTGNNSFFKCKNLI